MTYNIKVSQRIKNGTLFKAKKQIIADRFPPGPISGDYFVFLEEGECGVVENISIYRFEEDGIPTYHATFALRSPRSEGRISFSTKPSMNILPNFEDDYEILEQE